MRFPRPLRPGDTVGVTAPSSGVDASCQARLDLALRHLTDRGYRVREGACLRGGAKHVSAPAADRAREFMEFWLDPAVAAIVPPWGGELLIELLPLLDWGKLSAAPPTWLLGYSDISTLLFPLTLRADAATAHGPNLLEQVPEQTDPLVRECLRPLACGTGESIEQVSSALFEVKGLRYQDEPARGFALTAPTRWKRLGPDPDRAATFRGRMIGGCLDTLARLAGTPYGDLPGFAARYHADGLILYLENCEMPPPDAFRALQQLRLAGWFEGLTGLMFGRTRAPDGTGPEDLTQLDALRAAAADLAVPVLFDVDTGHVPPQLTIINGAMSEIAYGDGRGRLTQTLAA